MRRNDNREMLAAWARAGHAADEVRKQELRRYRHKDNIAIIDGLFQLGFDRRVKRLTTGLIEFQRLLARGRR